MDENEPRMDESFNSQMTTSIMSDVDGKLESKSSVASSLNGLVAEENPKQSTTAKVFV
jgi:hypothetical protein